MKWHPLHPLPHRCLRLCHGPAGWAFPLLAGLLAAPGPAAAQAQPAAVLPAPLSAQAQLPQATIEQALALVSHSAKTLAPASARVVVQAGALDSRLKLAPCADIKPYLPAGVPAWGRTRVGLRCADGTAKWSVLLPVQVQVLAPALVAAAALPAGLTLKAEHLQRVESDWGQSTQALLDDPQALVGRMVQRSVAQGQAFEAGLLAPRLWFAQGDTVQVEISGSGYRIVTDGQALAPGVEGRPVRVQTDAGRVVTGRPTGDRRVEVAL